MIQKLKMTLLGLSSLIMFAAPMALPAAVSAAVSQDEINSRLCGGANFDITNPDPNCKTNADPGSFNTKLATIINVLSAIIGVVAVIMIIFGGFRYITSGGASEKVTGAKNTILYAVIGLIIVALAQVIVKFVLNKSATT